MRKIILSTIGIVAIGVLGFATSTQAAPIYGSQDKVENGCLSPISVFVGYDCSYDGSNPVFFIPYLDIPFAWVGPIAGPSYYLPGESASGEQKRLRLSGDLIVDEFGTVSGTIIIGAGERVADCSQTTQCFESWDSITHSIPPSAAWTAVDNSAGGKDYTYSSIGYPVELEPCVPYPYFVNGADLGSCVPYPGINGFNFSAQLFPSVTPSLAVPNFYNGSWKTASPFPPFAGQHGSGPKTDTPGLTSVEGGFIPFIERNIGIQTTATMANYVCVGDVAEDCSSNVALGASAIPGPVPPIPGWTEGSPAYENLHLRISTNGAGTIISGEAFYVQEYSVLPFQIIHPDSWGGGQLDFSGIEAIAKDGESPDIQIDKKNILPITIYGSAGFDVTTIDPASLRFGPGEFSLQPTLGGVVHEGAHIEDRNEDGYPDMMAHFRSEDSDLRCGERQTKLRGTADGVPFVLSIQTNGIGKACQ